MTARATASSTRRGRPIDPSRRKMAGRKFSPSTKSIFPSKRPRTRRRNMCTYITEKTRIVGSAKGPKGWMRIDSANIYFDHPFHAPLDHALNIDFMGEADGTAQRV